MIYCIEYRNKYVSISNAYVVENDTSKEFPGDFNVTTFALDINGYRYSSKYPDAYINIEHVQTGSDNKEYNKLKESLIQFLRDKKLNDIGI